MPTCRWGWCELGRDASHQVGTQDRETAIRSLHRDDNNRFNPEGEGWVVRTWVELTDCPDSYMLLMDNDADGLLTLDRRRIVAGARFIVDTQRLWHVVVHTGDASRADHQLWSSPHLAEWVESERAVVLAEPVLR